MSDLSRSEAWQFEVNDAGMTGCRIDGQGNHWFRCHRGTVGCPVIHDGLTPHCIACAAGESCEYHELPALEMTEDDYYALGIVANPRASHSGRAEQPLVRSGRGRSDA
jgi:hypothetical protein